MIPRWAERYIGLRFVDKGRNLKGVDCWGLVRLVLLERAGIETPLHGEISSAELLTVARVITGSAAADPWRKVEGARPLDVVVMREKSFHVGIMVSETDVLHIERATDSVAPPLSRVRMAFEVIGFYRHKSLFA